MLRDTDVKELEGCRYEVGENGCTYGHERLKMLGHGGSQLGTSNSPSLLSILVMHQSRYTGHPRDVSIAWPLQ